MVLGKTNAGTAKKFALVSGLIYLAAFAFVNVSGGKKEPNGRLLGFFPFKENRFQKVNSMGALLVAIPGTRNQQFPIRNHPQRVIETVGRSANLDLAFSPAASTALRIPKHMNSLSAIIRFSLLPLAVSMGSAAANPPSWLQPPSPIAKMEIFSAEFVEDPFCLGVLPEIISDEDRIFITDELTQSFLAGCNNAANHAAGAAFCGRVAQFSRNRRQC